MLVFRSYNHKKFGFGFQGMPRYLEGASGPAETDGIHEMGRAQPQKLQKREQFLAKTYIII